jgi:hypothetical protein
MLWGGTNAVVDARRRREREGRDAAVTVAVRRMEAVRTATFMADVDFARLSCGGMLKNSVGFEWAKSLGLSR